MRNPVRMLTALALAVSAAACGGVDSPSTQAALDFSGTLNPGEQQSQLFSVSKTGEMQLTLQSLEPRPVLGFVLLSVGVPSGSTCLLTEYTIPQAAIGQTYSFPQITKGSYCLLIQDANLALTQPAAFKLRLLHP